MIVASAVFVMGNDQQRLDPELAGAETIVHVSDELFAKRNDGRRVLIVFGMSHVGVILRLNKGIGRQLTALAVSLKLPIEVKMIGQKKQLQQRMSLRGVVEIDLPVSDARLLEAVKLNRSRRYFHRSRWT